MYLLRSDYLSSLLLRQYDMSLVQAVSHEDITEAVFKFVGTFDPPLAPALHTNSLESQFSTPDDPPDYERANRVLKVSNNTEFGCF